MAGAALTLERLERAVPDQLDPETAHDLVRVVDRAVPSDGWCLLGLDPVAFHRTFQFSRDGSEGTRDLARLEAGVADVNRYVDLARAARPGGWLSRTHPGAQRSVRLNDHLRPQGITSELRLVLRLRHQVWGALVLFRRGGRPFDDDDVAVLTPCAPVLARVARGDGARRTPARAAPPAGLALLDAGDHVVSLTESALGWLAALVPGGEDGVGPDDVTRVLYDTAQAARAGRCAAFTRRTPSGQWLSISADVVDDHGAVGVQLRSATARERLDLAARSAALTGREAEVVEQVVRGRPTKQIAAALAISAWTVEDHLAAVYRKLGVRGRDELFDLLVDLEPTR